MQTTNEFITETGKYYISSYGNGWAYEITCQTTGDSLWFQDDDADYIKVATSDFNNEAELLAYFENF